jgi:hypothetical protein
MQTFKIKINLEFPTLNYIKSELDKVNEINFIILNDITITFSKKTVKTQFETQVRYYCNMCSMTHKDCTYFFLNKSFITCEDMYYEILKNILIEIANEQEELIHIN